MAVDDDKDDETAWNDVNPARAGGRAEELPSHLLSKLKIKVPGYDIISVIGHGGQATVYKAIEKTSSVTVAIKVLHHGPFADPMARERMAREFQVLNAINHPNIVCVLGQGVTPSGHDFIVMNYVEGRGLDEFMRESLKSPGRNEDPSSLLRLFKTICEIVNAPHLKGITHRDLSPSNIRIDLEGQPHILDFGLARTAFDRFMSPRGKDISITGEFMGKVAYASPEQARGNRGGVDVRADVYALGIILYQILTGGQFPYEVVGNLVDVLNNIISAHPTPPSKVIASREATIAQSRTHLRRRHPAVVNPAIEAIVLKALEKDRDLRYQTAGELAADVDNYLSGRPTVARLEHGEVTVKKSWVLAIYPVAGVVVAVAVAVIALLHYRAIDHPVAKVYGPPASTATSNSFPPSRGPASEPLPLSLIPPWRKIFGCPIPIAQIRFQANSNVMRVSGGSQGFAINFDLLTGRQLNVVANPRSFAIDSPAGDVSYAAGKLNRLDGSFVELDVKSPQGRAAFSADGKRIVDVGSFEDPTFGVFRVSDGKKILERSPVFSGIGGYDLSPDGRFVSVGGGGGGKSIVQSWDVDSGLELPRLTWSGGVRLRMRYSSDSKRVCVIHEFNGVSLVFEAATGRVLQRNQPGRGGGTIFVTPAGFVLSWYSSDTQRLSLWNPLLESQIGDLDVPASPSDRVVVSPDGTKLLTLGGDHILRLWNAFNCRLVGCFGEVSKPMIAAAFSPDGSLFAGGGDNGVVSIWQSP